jgi:hypothetical protein
MSRVLGDPNHRCCEDDEKGDKQAAARHRLHGNAATHDSRLGTP